MRCRPVVVPLASLVAAALGACNSGPKAETQAAAATTPTPASAAVAGEIVDQGAFLVSFEGAPVGRETFTIRKSGDTLTIEHDYDLKVGGNKLAGRGTLVTGA